MDGDTKTRALIQKMVQKLVAEYAPEKIVLFGSHAYGQPDADSDIDLLIIKATKGRFFKRLDRVRRVASGTHPHIPFEPIVLTPKEIERRVKAGDQFLSEILQKGEVLYAACGTKRAGGRIFVNETRFLRRRGGPARSSCRCRKN